MSSAPADDPILKRFCAALDEMYGGRLERVVLFGSRARGDAGEDSDYEIAVFLNDLKEGDLANRWRELDRLSWPLYSVFFTRQRRPSHARAVVKENRAGKTDQFF